MNKSNKINFLSKRNIFKIPLLYDLNEYNNEFIFSKVLILPIKNIVIFPNVITPITVTKSNSVTLLEFAYRFNKNIAIFTQKKNKNSSSKLKNIYNIGTMVRILKLLKISNNSITVILQGIYRIRFINYKYRLTYLHGDLLFISEKFPSKNDEKYYALVNSIKELSIKVMKLESNMTNEISFNIKNIESASFLVNFIAFNLNISIIEKQNILECGDLKLRAKLIYKILDLELLQIRLREKIQNKLKMEIERQQKEYYLNQQIRIIQEELGGINIFKKELNDIFKKSKKKKWPNYVEKHFNKEIKKLNRMNPQMPEYVILRNYLEFLLDLPWDYYTSDIFDLKKTKKILDKYHYGLDIIKDRLIEYLAVLKLKGNMKAPILCLYGPPGVGKTSLGKSIAKALNRKYIRISLGGVHDESEIRGHRKTYIGAMPGRILQSIRKAKSSNPVFILDEIDKMGISIYGDPASAMLEVLDPEQNISFYDNFLEMGYNLSKVLFIATANSLSSINLALLDRMEVIEINGYSPEEKLSISKIHLLPKLLISHGLYEKDINISNEILKIIIRKYTYESGVRDLERIISKILRYVARKKVTGDKYDRNINKNTLTNILGVSYKIEKSEKITSPGISVGLSWTNLGGEILYIESILTRGNGNLTLTGNIGKIMKESIIIAQQYVKYNYKELNIEYNKFEKYNIHIHVPEGAIPKDGPSAGSAILASLISIYKNKIIKNSFAITGEITLRGKILAVGGIKEKLLAAKRTNIKNVIIPYNNKEHVNIIKNKYLSGLNIYYVKYINEIVKLLF